MTTVKTHSTLSPMFETREVPTTISSFVNPYTDKVAEIAATVDKDGRSTVAVGLTVPAAVKAKTIRLLQQAGSSQPRPVTVRNTVAVLAGDKVDITFWTVPKITRKHPAK